MRLRRKFREFGYDKGIDDDSAGAAEVLDRPVDQSRHERIGAVWRKGLAQDSDALAARAIRVEIRAIGFRNMTLCVGRRGIGFVDSGDHVQKSHQIADGSGHRSGHVTGIVQTDHAGA